MTNNLYPEHEPHLNMPEQKYDDGEPVSPEAMATYHANADNRAKAAMERARRTTSDPVAQTNIATMDLLMGALLGYPI